MNMLSQSVTSKNEEKDYMYPEKWCNLNKHFHFFEKN